METKSKSEEKNCKCPHCGANMYVHGHNLSKGLVHTLIKFKNRVIEKKENRVHIKDELHLNNTQFGNYQKLRFHGLIAKCIDPVTKQHEQGYWLLTKRGNEFVKNMISIPKKVYTFRNKIVDKDKDFVTMQQVLKDEMMPYWDEKNDFICDYMDILDAEELKYDSTGQGLLF